MIKLLKLSQSILVGVLCSAAKPAAMLPREQEWPSRGTGAVRFGFCQVVFCIACIQRGEKPSRALAREAQVPRSAITCTSWALISSRWDAPGGGSSKGVESRAAAPQPALLFWSLPCSLQLALLSSPAPFPALLLPALLSGPALAASRGSECCACVHACMGRRAGGAGVRCLCRWPSAAP